MRDWLSHRAVVSPDAPALIESATDSSETYTALDARVEERATQLAALVAPSDTVGLLLDTTPAAVGLVHAAMRVGAVVVPLAPDQTESELTDRIERADLDLLVCERETEPLVSAIAGRGAVRDISSLAVDPSVAVRSIDDGGRVRALSNGQSEKIDDPDWQSDDPLCMLFTSGTTGHPKLVVLTVRNVFTSAVASADRLGTLPTDRWCSPLGLHHMGGLAPIYRSVIDGTCLILAPTGTDALLDALYAYEATGLSLVPVLLDRLLDARTLPESLRTVLLGGAPATTELIERCEERDVPVYPTYGMTETASQIATARPTETTTAPGTVGRPLFLTTVTIVNSDGRPVPAGEQGEIVVSGPTVTPGYHDDPEATAAAFCEYGFLTGDLGRLDKDNRLWIEGRVDDRILTGGKTVDPTEVTEVLCEHPQITDAAVVSIPDEQWGERVGALLETDGTADRSTIETHCRSRLAAHKVPRTVAFGSIPRTESGTVDRERVRERLTARTV